MKHGKKALSLLQEESSASVWSRSRLVGLCIPLMLEQILAFAVGMVDTVMVAKIDEAAMSGVSLVDSVNFLLIALFSAMATGGAVVCSQYLGRKEPEKASEAARQLIYLVTIISTVIMALALVFRVPMLKLIYGQLEADVMENALIYLLVTALSFPFLAIYNGGAALFRSMSNSQVSMKISLAMNLINFVGNYIGIFILHQGVLGAAIPTLISRMFAALLITHLLCRPDCDPIHLRGLSRIRLDREHIRTITKIGIPSGVEGSIFQVGKILVTRLIADFGKASIAAYAASSALGTFVNVPGTAIGLAMVTVVGQCIGARDYAAAKRYTRQLLLTSMASMGVLSLALYLFRYPLVGIFSSLSAEGRAIAVSTLVIIAAASPIFWSTSFALPAALRATGDAKFTMLVSIFSMWTFRIGFAYLLATRMGMGVPGVWLAMVIDWIVRSTFFIARWLRGRWQEHQLISG